jgi:hypothetical protein
MIDSEISDAKIGLVRVYPYRRMVSGLLPAPLGAKGQLIGKAIGQFRPCDFAHF